MAAASNVSNFIILMHLGASVSMPKSHVAIGRLLRPMASVLIVLYINIRNRRGGNAFQTRALGTK